MKNGPLKVYKGYPHGMLTVNAGELNAEHPGVHGQGRKSSCEHQGLPPGFGMGCSPASHISSRCSISFDFSSHRTAP
jgi:hypothetical protein